jgi:hypothetical protein
MTYTGRLTGWISNRTKQTSTKNYFVNDLLLHLLVWGCCAYLCGTKAKDMNNTINKHCKVQYQVLVPYSDDTFTQVIEVNGKTFTIGYLPRPCASVADLYAVIVNGVKYPTLAKFLKSVK